MLEIRMLPKFIFLSRIRCFAVKTSLGKYASVISNDTKKMAEVLARIIKCVIIRTCTKLLCSATAKNDLLSSVISNYTKKNENAGWKYQMS